MIMPNLPRGAAALLLASLVIPGCGPEHGDPTLAAAADFNDSLEMDGVLDLLGPGGPVLADHGPPGLACDADPEISMATLCGHDYAAAASYAWTDCLVDPPGGRPAARSSGTLELVRDVDDAQDCGVLDLDETATFTLSLAAEDRSVGVTGTLHALAQRDLAGGGLTRSTTLAITRTLDRGDEQRTVELAGELEISVEDEAIRTVDGVIDVSADEDATITLTGVVQGPRSQCAWPTAGTLVRDLGDVQHTLSFGPECGEGVLDGEVVDLQQRPRRRH